jgi:hypothetical protein
MKPENAPLIKVQFTPEDSKKHFLVQIPTSIVANFKKLDGKEKHSINESLRESWKRQDDEWQAAMEVSSSLILETCRKFTPLGPGDYDEFIDAVTKAAEQQTDRSIKQDVLQIIKLTSFRRLNLPCLMPIYKSAVLMAIEDNDHGFFKHLGRALGKNPIRFKMPKERPPLERLLLGDWINNIENGPHLCCFTDQALSDFLHCVAPESGPTFDAVRKTRYRLGLKQTRRKLIKVVKPEGKSLILG